MVSAITRTAVLPVPARENGGPAGRPGGFGPGGEPSQDVPRPLGFSVSQPVSPAATACPSTIPDTPTPWVLARSWTSGRPPSPVLAG
jgi:hypothetical protein